MKTKASGRSLKRSALALCAASILAAGPSAASAAQTNRTLFARPDALSGASSYAFTTTTSGTFTDMSSGTTQLVAPGAHNVTSAITNLPFDFYMLGTRSTKFSVGSNGYIQLSAANGSSPDALGTPNVPLITALGGDLGVSSRGGKIHHKVTGSAPNRVLTVEFLNMTIIYDGFGAQSNGTYQVHSYKQLAASSSCTGPMNRNTTSGQNTLVHRLLDQQHG